MTEANQTSPRFLNAANNAEESSASLLETADFARLGAWSGRDHPTQQRLEQYFTPADVARLMASMVTCSPNKATILDPGAGTGILSAALVEALIMQEIRPNSIELVAYELDKALVEPLEYTLRACQQACESQGVSFRWEVRNEDFIRVAATQIRDGLLGAQEEYTHIILNPPYKKLQTGSEERALLDSIGLPVTNLYAAFMGLSVVLLKPKGQLVSITPRSFCSGPYFTSFRKYLLERMRLLRLHVFESRSKAFSHDSVLQENIIVHGSRESQKAKPVIVTGSETADDDAGTYREVPFEQVVNNGDKAMFIHLVSDELNAAVGEQIRSLNASLQDLGIAVSTGRVVDFRATEHLRSESLADTVPLIYPGNFQGGYVAWPRKTSKPVALAASGLTDSLLLDSGYYTLVKRFSSKEERRRVVAAVLDPKQLPAGKVAIENHINFFHRNGVGLERDIAVGLAAYLNSSMVDDYFRQFSGHTQVNATDLRKLSYPTSEQLRRLGARIEKEFPDQHELDKLVEAEVFKMATSNINIVAAKRKIEESLAILRELGLPRQQLNERSALTLLALLDLEPETPWVRASSPLCGITQMMDYFAQHYGKNYAPNTRETVRRQTVHQFLQAGLIVANPDKPQRPINSPKTVYQIEPSTLELVQAHGAKDWAKRVSSHKKVIGSLRERYEAEREMQRIPVVYDGKEFTLSAGGQNKVIKAVLDQFCPRYTPGGKLIYVGDSGEKFAVFDEALLKKLGVVVDAHGKMPDVVIHFTKKNWLVLVEAVTSHGPVDAKRHDELKALFKESSAGLVFVTAFPDRKMMGKYLSDISWETEVWVASSPTHLIHFNGERFLGPY